MILFNLEQACNLDCVYCKRNSASFVSRKLDLTDFKKVLDSSDYDVVCFSGGGEPTCSPDLISYIKFAKSLGFTVRLETNAIKLSDLSYFDSLIDAGLSDLIISLPSLNKAVYETVTGVNGSFDLIKKAFDNIILRKIKIYSVIITVVKQNLNSITSVVSGLSKYCSGFVVSHARPNSYINNPEDYVVKYSDLARVMLESKLDIRLTSGAGFIPFCVFRDCDDDVLQKLYGCVAVDLAERTFIDVCLNCKMKSSCSGIPKRYLDIYGSEEFVAMEFALNHH